MKTKINSRWSNAVIFECEANTIREACEKATIACKSLNDAYLRGAYLRGAELNGADLRYADLSGADLLGADLSGADLRGATLSGADLFYTDLNGADLRGATLSGTELINTDLSGADLRGATLPKYGLARIENIHQVIYDAASQPNALNMKDWHTCAKTHCRAGWAVVLAGDAGKALENRLGTLTAAALIYMYSDPTLEKIPDFLASNEDALADMKHLAKR